MVKSRGDRRMTKKEQVENIAKERNEIKDIMKLLDRCGSLNPMCKAEVATIIYGNNYRKIPEDSVVLSREEYEKGIIERESMRNQIAELFNDREQASKETAEKVFKMLISKLESNQFLSGKRIIMEVDVENLAKQFDVEIEG